MDLILWRHADAEDGQPDLERKLSARGSKQAARVAQWLRARLPQQFLTIASPAARTRQTADALDTGYTVDARLAPGAEPADYLAAARWPAGSGDESGAVVLVGHQPTIGRVASLLLAGTEQYWSVKKGAVWWLSTRVRSGRTEVVLRTVVSPDQID